MVIPLLTLESWLSIHGDFRFGLFGCTVNPWQTRFANYFGLFIRMWKTKPPVLVVSAFVENTPNERSALN